MDTSKEGDDGKPDKKALDSVARALEKQHSQLRGETAKGKSCKGCLYYSSYLKSKGTNPRCIGIPRTLHQVPNYVGKTEVEASQDGRTLSEFYYSCVGYSVFVNKDRSTGKQASPGDLPVCVGIELLVDRRVNRANRTSAPAHMQGKEDTRPLPPPPQTHKPAHSATDDFLSRYTRNASLVAAGVARNMRRVGNYVKQSVDDILYPYRRRPK